MVNKSKYYAHVNGLDPADCAPSLTNGYLVLPAMHADAINEIQDDDPDFLAWRAGSTLFNIVRAVRSYVEAEIDAAGMILIQDLVAAGSQKATECKEWGLGVYTEAEHRKALVLADMWPDDKDPCDFSSFGPKPYTVAQLLAER